MDPRVEYAQRIIKHYIEMASMGTVDSLDWDNTSEIDAAIGGLYEAAVEEAVRRVEANIDTNIAERLTPGGDR